MGELIEIGIVSKNKSLYCEMLDFLERHLTNEETFQIISVMDNWHYDNMIEINSIEEAENYMETKIVTIEKRSPCEQIGVSVEKNKKGYIIECWINPYKEVIGKEYCNFINEIIKYLKDKNMVDVCGIGKEVSVDYDKSIYSLINDSHNIDIWLISQQFFIDNKLSDLNIKAVII